MTFDRLKGLVFPVAALLVLEAAARITHLRSDLLAAPSEIAMAFGEALADGSLLTATRYCRHLPVSPSAAASGCCSVSRSA